MPIEIPTDIFKIIIGFLDLRDIYVIRQVCHEFNELTKSRSLWSSLFQRYILNHGLPVPRLYGKAPEHLSALELEQSLHRARKLRRNWISKFPTIVNRFTLPAIPDTRIVSMHVLPGHEKALLLALSMQTYPTRKFTFRCWDVDAQPPVCLATYECSKFRGLAVNKRSRNGARIIAIREHHAVNILSLEVATSGTEEGRFAVTAVFPDERNAIQLFSDSLLLCREPESGTMHLWDIDSPGYRINLQSPHQLSPVLDVVLSEEFAVVLRSTHLEFYALPIRTLDKDPKPAKPSSSNPLILHPIFAFQWPWRIDNAGMTLGSVPRTPITILLRYGSYFPWAINLLHHYELLPNQEYMPGSPMTQGNLPYESINTPVLRDTIGSPVRLHATSDMTIGDYGTAIWTDSHTEDFYGHADRGQRVAGRFSKPYTNPYTSTLAELTETESERGAEVAEEDGEDEGAAGQVASATATSVYAHQEEDSWVRLALDETEGRIFLGKDDGRIEVLEYL